MNRRSFMTLLGGGIPFFMFMKAKKARAVIPPIGDLLKKCCYAIDEHGVPVKAIVFVEKPLYDQLLAAIRPISDPYIDIGVARAGYSHIIIRGRPVLWVRHGDTMRDFAAEVMSRADWLRPATEAFVEGDKIKFRNPMKYPFFSYKGV